MTLGSSCAPRPPVAAGVRGRPPRLSATTATGKVAPCRRRCSSARSAAALPLAAPVLNAGPGQPPIIARRAWAAGQAHPRNGPFYGTVKLAFVHHTVNPNGYSAAAVPSLLRAIFDYHVQVRGFFDIAYNFIIDAYGRIWEARAGGIDMAVVGAHAGAYNAQSTGVAMLGDFMNVVPRPAAMNALQHLLAWKLSLHGKPARGRANVIVDPADAFYTPFRPEVLGSLRPGASLQDGRGCESCRRRSQDGQNEQPEGTREKEADGPHPRPLSLRAKGNLRRR